MTLSNDGLVKLINQAKLTQALNRQNFIKKEKDIQLLRRIRK